MNLLRFSKLFIPLLQDFLELRDLLVFLAKIDRESPLRLTCLVSRDFIALSFQPLGDLVLDRFLGPEKLSFTLPQRRFARAIAVSICARRLSYSWRVATIRGAASESVSRISVLQFGQVIVGSAIRPFHWLFLTLHAAVYSPHALNETSALSHRCRCLRRTERGLGTRELSD